MAGIDEIGFQKLMIGLVHAGQNSLKEGWQDAAPPGHDTNLWTAVTVGTGGVARDLTEAPFQKQLLTGPANADVARLHSVQRWTVGPTIWSSQFMYKSFLFMWEARFVTVASIDNALFFMGLMPSTVATRATQELIGFVLTADALNSLTDTGGVETLNAVGAPALVQWHTYGILVYSGGIVFYIDGAVVAQHITNLPDQAFYLTWYLPQEAAANGGEFHIGANGCFYQFVVR